MLYLQLLKVVNYDDSAMGIPPLPAIAGDKPCTQPYHLQSHASESAITPTFIHSRACIGPKTYQSTRTADNTDSGPFASAGPWPELNRWARCITCHGSMTELR